METRRVCDLSVLAAWREDEDPQKLPASRTFRHGTVLEMLPSDRDDLRRFTIQGEDNTVWVSGAGELAKETEPTAEAAKKTLGGNR